MIWIKKIKMKVKMSFSIFYYAKLKENSSAFHFFDLAITSKYQARNSTWKWVKEVFIFDIISNNKKKIDTYNIYFIFKQWEQHELWFSKVRPIVCVRMNYIFILIIQLFIFSLYFFGIFFNFCSIIVPVAVRFLILYLIQTPFTESLYFVG